MLRRREHGIAPICQDLEIVALGSVAYQNVRFSQTLP